MSAMKRNFIFIILLLALFTGQAGSPAPAAGDEIRPLYR